jgi:hypothetical protein
MFMNCLIIIAKDTTIAPWGGTWWAHGKDIGTQLLQFNDLKQSDHIINLQPLNPSTCYLILFI